ncbi:aminoglycoside phosphotransferase family protein [Mycoplasmatota bacterium WC44]
MMEKSEIIVNNVLLKPVIEKLLDKENVKISSFDKYEYQSGTLGEVFLFSGECLSTNEVIGWEVVLKVQNKWNRFGDPESWLREKNIYESNILDELPSNLKVPKCIKIEEKDNRIWLWIEKAVGNHDSNLKLEEYGLIARSIGDFQHRFVDNTPLYSWLSSKYWIVKNTNIWCGDAISWLLDESKKDNSILSRNCIKTLLNVWSKKDEYTDFLLNMPKTLCHRDLTPGNVFVSDDNVTVIDWDCLGTGFVGEDIVDLFAESLVFYNFDINKANDLKEVLINNYYSGMKESGVELNRIEIAFNLYLVLNWSYRIICRFKHSDEETISRYTKILEYITDTLNKN